ncbi:MAG: RNA-directed DNA polymerase [Candidatus Peribacteria bacterium]|nr:RNA-directed DNA polymerase [Candidatus Peribacteria bacterium]
MAIGNLTSQLFANIYLDRLDTYLKYELGFHWYGRYVDDFVLFHQDKQQLLQAIPLIRSFLSDQLHLALHPKKIYLQPLLNGVLFL